jgi:seryl-tRNA synthetase
LGPSARRAFGDILPYCLAGVDEYRVTAGSMPAVSFVVPDEGRAARIESSLAEAFRRAVGADGVAERVLLDMWDEPAVHRGAGRDVQPVGRGLVVGGPLLARIIRALDGVALDIAARAGAVEHAVPHLVDWSTVERAGYLGNFPQHLTACSVVDTDLGALDRFAATADRSARRAELVGTDACVAPAVCLHLYARLASSTLPEPTVATVRSGCARYEAAAGDSTTRLWSFTMREIVYLGTADGALRFRDTMVQELSELAQALGLPARLLSASDPFFTADRPDMTAYQSRFDVKHELCARMADDGQPVAVSSVNYHGDHFGAGFGIATADGVASSACVGFGLERWAQWLADWLGDDTETWPDPLRAHASGSVASLRG